MEIQLNYGQVKRLEELACKEGKSIETLLAELIDDALFARGNGRRSRAGEPSLEFHDMKTDLEALTTSEGIKPVASLGELLGDFWPEEESADDFILAVKKWRSEGRKKDQPK